MYSNINEYKDKQSQSNKELVSLLNNQQKSLEENKRSTEEINVIKDLITHKEEEFTNIINELREDSSILKNELMADSSKLRNELSTQVSNQTNNIQKALSDNGNETVNQLINGNETVNQLINWNETLNQLINDNFRQLNDNISQNDQKSMVISSAILEKINDINYNKNFEDMKSLVADNKKELTETYDKIINVYNETSEKLIDDVMERIKVSNNELISNISDDSIKTKINILNKISDDLHRGNYVNLMAYKKIKDLNLFDEVYYKRTYDYTLDIDPLLHFIYKGYDENKKPSPEFDPMEYKQSHENIKKSGLNPLVYFVNRGINEGNIKINNDLEEVKHINKYTIDEDIENFDIRGVKKSKRKPRLIVSTTSVPEHMNDLHYTLYSLLNQQLKADKVILWLNEDKYPNQEIDLPREVLKLKQNGLSIRFTKNYKNFNSIIPVLTTYPNDIIITANDNIYYPQDWLKNLYNTHKNNPENIITYKTQNITTNSENNIEEYEKWELNNNQKNISYRNIANHKAGVLYPPKTLHEDLINNNKFNKYSENIDTWLWAMTILNHNKIKTIPNDLIYELTYVNPAREIKLFNNHKKIHKNTKTDINTSLKNIVNKYPEIINIINEEKN
ncbi:hypothetical protein PXD04_09090 [Methanosphaera sp. ISO3-F5]|uniref:hypothetical protein n=1 Tax=Methanosphaera sp. ISO3-F5 TaxID=1452353 RepID=UPI002B26466B|nr:hypothetical protein [Methanosphaera sp. ISO3-F5]WQH63843.1 hypothetical protein PXD04_09090 [Methanosphaera sp. ISO3-F5]